MSEVDVDVEPALQVDATQDEQEAAHQDERHQQ